MKVTARLQVVKEFLQTEKNYVGILHTLLNVSGSYCALEHHSFVLQ